MSKKVLVPIFLLVLALVVVTGVVSAGGAVVYNNDDQGMTCTFSINGGSFSGPATLVLVDGTQDGKIQMHCHAKLLGGDAGPVQKMRNFPFYVSSGWIRCNVQIAKSGNANVSCPNQYAQPMLSW